MEKFVERTLLDDFYGELLTKRQQQIYESVVLEDYSLSEVAEELNISRQGVHDMIKRCNHTLEDYEARLHLVAKFLTAKEKIKEIHTLSRRLLKEDKEQMEEDIRQIESVCNQVLEDL